MLWYLRISVAIIGLIRKKESQGYGYKQVEEGDAIAGYGEGQHIRFGFRAGNEDIDKNDVQDHSLHQHPHEGHQEEVVEEDSYDLAVDGDVVAC